MLKKMVGGKLLLFVLILFFVMPAFAGDLQMVVNKAEQTLTISNTLLSKIYIVHMVSGGIVIPVNVDLEGGSTVVVSYTGEMPSSIDYASCIPGPESPDGLAGYQKSADGFYHLSVDML